MQPGQGAHIRTSGGKGGANAAPVDDNFDFEAMLSGFNKMAASQEASNKVKPGAAYNKTSSFFDSLDEEVAEDGPRKGRQFLDEMRKVDVETFGEELAKSSNRGGKGVAAAAATAVARALTARTKTKTARARAAAARAAATAAAAVAAAAAARR